LFENFNAQWNKEQRREFLGYWWLLELNLFNMILRKEHPFCFISLFLFGFIFCLSNCKKQDDSVVGNSNVEEPVVSDLVITPNQSHFGYFQDTTTLFIKNIGKTAFDWSLKEQLDFVDFSIVSGNLDAGDSILITLVLDRTDLGSSDKTFKATFENSHDFEEQLSIRAKHHIEEKLLLEYPIVDAEYDNNNDVIIAITSQGELLLRINPETKEIDVLEVHKIPLCVSISPDGKYAAVGQSGAVSYINLETFTLEKIYSTNTRPSDIVLGGNDWVYLFPDNTGLGWKWINCLYLPSGGIIPNEGSHVWGNNKAKRHPSGNYIYAVTNGISSAGAEKYDISEGVAKHLYDSPWAQHFNGNIWISEDGSRLYSKGRSVFTSSQDQNIDMTSQAELPADHIFQKIVELDESMTANKVYAIYYTMEDGFPFAHPERFIRKHNAHAEYRGKIKMPQFLVPDGNGNGALYPGNPRYCFFNNDGTKIHVLATAEVKDAYEDHWALVSFDVE
jgi:hypothetical protein